MSTPVAALASFRTNNEQVAYQILRVDANGVGQGYSSGMGLNGGWTLDEAQQEKERMEQFPWNKDVTLHIVRKTVTETYELI